MGNMQSDFDGALKDFRRRCGLDKTYDPLFLGCTSDLKPGDWGYYDTSAATFIRQGNCFDDSEFTYSEDDKKRLTQSGNEFY